MHSVHKKVITSPVCGFDQWMDNHYAYDGDMSSGGPPKMIDTYVNKAKKMGLQYHWWSMPGQHRGAIQGGPPDRFGDRPHGGPHNHHRNLQPGGMT